MTSLRGCVSDVRCVTGPQPPTRIPSMSLRPCGSTSPMMGKSSAWQAAEPCRVCPPSTMCARATSPPRSRRSGGSHALGRHGRVQLLRRRDQPRSRPPPRGRALSASAAPSDRTPTCPVSCSRTAARSAGQAEPMLHCIWRRSHGRQLLRRAPPSPSKPSGSLRLQLEGRCQVWPRPVAG